MKGAIFVFKRRVKSFALLLDLLKLSDAVVVKIVLKARFQMTQRPREKRKIRMQAANGRSKLSTQAALDERRGTGIRTHESWKEIPYTVDREMHN